MTRFVCRKTQTRNDALSEDAEYGNGSAMPTEDLADRNRLEAVLMRAALKLMAEVPALVGSTAHVQREESATHRFAHHLAGELEGGGLFVDTELDRDAQGAKPSPVGASAIIDIAVHRRDPLNVGNLLAIEVKWDDARQTGRASVAEAKQKAAEYHHGRLRYRFAAVLTLPRLNDSLFLEWLPASGTPWTRVSLATTAVQQAGS